MNPFPKPVIAAFDFDGTITYQDTLLSFLIYTHGYIRTIINLVILSPWLIGFLTRLVPRQTSKERVLAKFYKGWPIEKLRDKGRQFALKKLSRKVRPKAMQRIQWHLERGHRCILISASLDIYLTPWAQSAGFDRAITSRLDTTEEHIVTGKLLGLNCWGPEKMRRLIEALGPRKNYTLYAYGDSRGDAELLAAADYPFYKVLE